MQQARLTPGVNQDLIRNAEQYLWQLECAIHRDQILGSASHRIVSEARKNPPFDPEATQIKALVTEAILRGASTQNPARGTGP